MAKKNANEKTISIEEFITFIQGLPEDEPYDDPDVWYRSQKEHWLGWLSGYNGPGAYGRKTWKRDAKFVYNHIVCAQMLIYLAGAIPLQDELIEAAITAYEQNDSSLMAQAGAVRKVIPWSEIYQAMIAKQ